MSTKLIILAAGMSSRMKNSTDLALDAELVKQAKELPKCMIPVGKSQRPMLDYLLGNVVESGYTDVTIVINETDRVTRGYYANNELGGLNISFAVQAIPKGRTKPLGTAEALLNGMNAKPDWGGEKFTVCNSDNLYSVNVMKLLAEDTHPNAMIDYDQVALGVEPERVNAFAVIKKDKDGYLADIIEKPNRSELQQVEDENGRVGVSMNIFSFSASEILPYLISCPINPERDEKELPTAIKNMIAHNPRSVFTIPVSEVVPDLTKMGDIQKVSQLVDH